MVNYVGVVLLWFIMLEECCCGLLCWRSVVVVYYVGGVLLWFIMLKECCCGLLC